MKNNEITKRLLTALQPSTVALILENIASHYGITPTEAKAEVIDDEAEDILDYVTGSVRTATSLQLKRLSLSATA